MSKFEFEDPSKEESRLIPGIEVGSQMLHFTLKTKEGAPPTHVFCVDQDGRFETRDEKGRLVRVGKLEDIPYLLKR